MSRTYLLSRLLRQTPNRLFKQYSAELDLLGTSDLDVRENDVDAVHAAIIALPQNNRQQIEAHFRDIDALASERGFRATSWCRTPTHGYRPGCRPRAAGGDVGGEGRRLRELGAAHTLLAPARASSGGRTIRPVATHGVLEALQSRGGLAGRHDRQEARLSRQGAVRRPVQERAGRQVSASGHRGRIRKRRVPAFRFLCAERVVRGVCLVRPRAWARPGSVRHLSSDTWPALAGGRWQRDTVALPRGSRPLCQSRQGIRLLWLSRRQGTYLCLTLRATCREPRRPISILAHDWSRAGALAFRISDPAGPGAAQSSAERALLYAPR